MSLLVPHSVGVRHLSPAGALHVRRVLEEVDPTLVLVEAPAGAETELRHLVSPQTRPPVALLAFTSERPVTSFTYPLASYSPEWIACAFALERGRTLRFIDLPAETFLALQREEEEARRAADPAAAPAEHPLDGLGRVVGTDRETWWERTFEHTLETAAYVDAVRAYATELRLLDDEGYGARTPLAARQNGLREAFMRAAIRDALAEGHAPARAVVVCGAYHVQALHEELPPLTRAEREALPRAPAVVTLMPYSYERLHARSGYGAGNRAPAYFELLHRHLLRGTPQQAGAEFLSAVARRMRADAQPVSPAQVIEAARLAEALSALREAPALTLTELRDAATTCLADGSELLAARALDAVETGASVGALPPGVSRTALQEDLRAQLAELRLERYLTEQPQPLELDLREDRYARSEEGALLDRRRSIFFHRLGACDVALATAETARARLTSWKERWSLRWTPLLELRIAELSLRGDSVAQVVSLALSERLLQAQDCAAAAEVLLQASTCSVADALDSARARIQQVATLDESVGSMAAAAERLLTAVRYGGIRAIDPEPLWPLIEQVFRRATLFLPTAVHCDDAARPQIAGAIVTLARLSVEEGARLPAQELTAALRGIALRDDGNPYLAGLATAVLLEQQALSDEQVAGALSRRLSAAEEPDIAAGYFEGLASHNRLALLSRPPVWRLLSTFVDALEPEAFLRALVPLRRAFAAFTPAEVRRVVAALAEAWSAKAAQPQLAQALQAPLDATEVAALNESLGGLEDLDL